MSYYLHGRVCQQANLLPVSQQVVLPVWVQWAQLTARQLLQQEATACHRGLAAGVD